MLEYVGNIDGVWINGSDSCNDNKQHDVSDDQGDFDTDPNVFPERHGSWLSFFLKM